MSFRDLIDRLAIAVHRATCRHERVAWYDFTEVTGGWKNGVWTHTSIGHCYACLKSDLMKDAPCEYCKARRPHLASDHRFPKGGEDD